MKKSTSELGAVANNGVDEILELQRPIGIRDKVSFGDFIQFAGAVGMTNCPGAPSLEFMAGRFNFSFASPDGLVPEPTDPMIRLWLGLMQDFRPMKSWIFCTPGQFDSQFDSHFFIEVGSFVGIFFFERQYLVKTLLTGSALPGNGSKMREVASPLGGEFRL
ncbi:Peroxidase [Mycena venus]|uniref:Peroxidase n=1 Tax=Mycena venus TaxID=2733690 RepID=A0A8H6Z0C0_9AGAR|nr:Peroxidase [Mycena venus]